MSVCINTANKKTCEATANPRESTENQLNPFGNGHYPWFVNKPFLARVQVRIGREDHG